MSDKVTPTLLEAIQSGKCFKRSGNIYKFKDDAMYMWVQDQWEPTAENWQRVEYCDDPSLRPRPCTFMEAWEHVKKYPGKEVCTWKHYRCHNVNGDIFNHLDDDLFANRFACTIIDSNDWKLIPQKEGE